MTWWAGFQPRESLNRWGIKEKNKRETEKLFSLAYLIHVINKTHRIYSFTHLTFNKKKKEKANPNTWWFLKTPKSLKLIEGLLNLPWFCSFRSHSQTLLWGRISVPCLPETCLWLLWYSTLNESCLVVIMGRRLLPPPVPALAPSSGSRQNYICFWALSNQAD